jgi:drug/metabolite transporter (DMT)-like permease
MSESDLSRLARWLIVAAALMWSTSGFFAKAPWFDQWPAEHRGVALTFWRAVFAAIAVLPFVRRPAFRPAMIPMSMAFTGMTYCFLVAMVAGSETTTIWLQYVGPAWVALGGLIGLGDRPSRRDGMMVGLMLIGISIIVVLESKFGGGSTASKPIVLALLSGVTYACVLLSLRHLRGIDVAWLGLVNYSVSAICLAPLVIGKVPMPEGGQWLALALFGSLQLAIPYVLFAWAVRHVQSNEASLITLIEPMAVPVWTFVVWRHHPTYRFPEWWTLLGGMFIAAGFIWRYAIAKPKQIEA